METRVKTALIFGSGARLRAIPVVEGLDLQGRLLHGICKSCGLKARARRR